MAVSPLKTGGKLLGRFLGNTIGEGAAFAAGVAIGPILGPPVQALRNTVNAQYPFVAPEPGTLAEGVAQGQVERKAAEEWASYHGISGKAFAALVSIASTGPGRAAAFDLWRRGLIDDNGFRRAVQREGVEAEWIAQLLKTKRRFLDPADLARGIHRGLIPDPGLLRGELPRHVGHVPAYPVYPIDALESAAAHGYERDDLGVLVGLQGNPMGAHEAAEALFRGVLTPDDYLRAVAEGNTRNEWAEAIREQSRQIPTARDFVENALRGYRTLEEAIAGAALHGMSAEAATMIYQNQGRPMTLHHVTTGLARGGKFEPEPGEITDPYRAAIVEGSLKPAYYDLELANRYSYPSPAYFRLLQTTGVITAEEAEQRYLELGWPPDFARKIAQALSRQRGTASKEATVADLATLYQGYKITRAELLAQIGELGYSPDQAELKAEVADAARVKSARDTAITGLHTAFKKHHLDGSYPAGTVTPTPAQVATAAQAGIERATSALEALGLPEWARTRIVAAWRVERDAADTATPLEPIPGP